LVKSGLTNDLKIGDAVKAKEMEALVGQISLFIFLVIEKHRLVSAGSLVGID
jgi:hypothetical protein